MGRDADATARQIKSINRMLNDPGLNINQRLVAEQKKKELLQILEQQRRGEIPRNPQNPNRQNQSQANGRRSPGANGNGGRNAVNSRAKPTFNPRVNPLLRPSIFNFPFAALSLPANLREGWIEGTSGPLGNPVYGAVQAFNEAAGAFVPAADIADEIVDAGFDLLDFALGTLGGNSNLGEKYSTEDPIEPNPNTTSEGFEYTPADGGQEPGVIYTFEVAAISSRNSYTFQDADYQRYSYPGPIGYEKNYELINDAYPYQGQIYLIANGERVQDSNGYKVLSGFSSIEFSDFELFADIRNVNREDGLPDTYVPPSTTPNPNRQRVVQPTPLSETSPPDYKEPEKPNPFNIPGLEIPIIPGLAPDPIPEDVNKGRPDKRRETHKRRKSTPNVPRNSAESQTRSNPNRRTRRVSKVSKNPEGCNPVCSAPGINQTKDTESTLLDAIKNGRLGSVADIPELAVIATILDVVNGISGAVGVNAFPINAPTTINQCDTRPPRQINNLAEGQLWQTDQLDSVMGQWCNTMEVDTPDGKKELKMDTMADATQEMMGLLISMAIGQGLNQQGIMKGLAEMTQIKQQSFLSTQFSRANAEYLGYTANQTKVNMPSSVTPGANSLLDFLNPSQLSTLGYRNQDTTDLQTCLRELCHAAAIIRAVFQRNVNPDNIANDLKGQFDRARGVAAGRDDSDFDDFVRDVELGFDIPNAYGRIFNNRPQIRKKDG